MAETRARLGPLSATLVGLCLLAYVIVALWGIGAHWLEGHDGWTGAQLAISAVNTVRFGPRATKFSRTDYYTGATAPTDRAVYWPTYSAPEGLLLATVFRALGPEPWVARALYLLISVVTFLLIVRLSLTQFGRGTALLAAALLAFMPSFAFYGRMATYDVPAMCVGMLVVTVYLAWIRAPENRRLFIALHSLVVIAVFWGYTIHFLVPLLLLHYAIFRDPTRASPHLLRTLPVVWLGAACLFLLQVAFIRGPGFFVERLRRRTGIQSSYLPSLGFLHDQADRLAEHFTPLLCALIIGWGVVLIARGCRGTVRRSPVHLEVAFRGTLARSDATLLLLLYPAAYLVFFKDLTAIHDYVLVSLVPFVALASADALSRAAGKLPIPLATLLLVVFGGAYVRQSVDILATRYHHLHYEGLDDIELARYVGAKTRAGDKVALDVDPREHIVQFKFYMRNGFDFADTVSIAKRDRYSFDRAALRTAIADPAVRFIILDTSNLTPMVLRKVLSRFAVEEIQNRLVVDLRRHGPHYVHVSRLPVPQSTLHSYLTSFQYTPFRYEASEDPASLLRLVYGAGLAVAALSAPPSSLARPRNFLANPSAREGFTAWTRIEAVGSGRWDVVTSRPGSHWRCIGFSGPLGHSGWKSDTVRVTAGVAYRIRGEIWTAGQKSGVAALRVDWYAQDGSLLQESPSLTTPLGVTAWTRVGTVVQAPPRAALADVKFFLDGQPPVTLDTRFRKIAFGPALGWRTNAAH